MVWQIIFSKTDIFQFCAMYLIHIIDWMNLLCVIAVLNNSHMCANTEVVVILCQE